MRTISSGQTEGRPMLAHEAQVEDGIDPAQEMTLRHTLLEAELVKQRRRSTCCPIMAMSHHHALLEAVNHEAPRRHRAFFNSLGRLLGICSKQRGGTNVQ